MIDAKVSEYIELILPKAGYYIEGGFRYWLTYEEAAEISDKLSQALVDYDMRKRENKCSLA